MGVLLLVRHGQASFGATDYDVLSPTGWTQGPMLGAWLAERHVIPRVVLSGTMRRHRETAAALVEGATWTLEPSYDPGWNETDLGVRTTLAAGRPTDAENREYQRGIEEASDRWMSGHHDGEYEESWSTFSGRVARALDQAATLASTGKTVVAVTSVGPIAAVCSSLAYGSDDSTAYGRLWNGFNTMLINSSLTRVVVGATGRRLLTFNEHPHLEKRLLTYR